MKKLLVATLLLSASTGIAQQMTLNPDVEPVVTTNEFGQTVTMLKATSHGVTPPASEWPVATEAELKEMHSRKIPNNFDRDAYLEAQDVFVNDPVRQDEQGTRAMRAPIENWNGQSGAFPPDPSGAAGPDHYVQAVNSTYRVFSKSGVGLTGALTLNSVWGISGGGDPIVMYDRHADRWFISQFAFSGNTMMLAVSQTADPTGAYNTYTWSMGSSFPDYPKFSIWWDGYYMTSNSTNTAVVFERDVMLAGGASPQMVKLSLPSLGNGGFRSPLPADADGDLPPNGTPCYFFNLEDNAFSGVSQDQIEIYEMTTNWGTGSASVVSSQQLSVPSFDAVFTGGFANIAQPGTSQKIDAIQGVLMYRAQHMRWVGYNTIILSHAVDLGSNASGVRWYELRDADNGVWSVFQSGTYSPGTEDRFMSSAAMDGFGNIGLAYSIVDAGNTIYPGISYTGRLKTDPLGTMTFAEEVAVVGLASQTAADRYGDYAQMSLDPDGRTFWYTGEYLGSGASRRTRIFSFDLQGTIGLEEDNYHSDLTLEVIVGEAQIDVAIDGIFGNEEVVVELIGMDGRVIATSLEKPINNKVNNKIDAISLKTGIYFVRVGNHNFQKAMRILVSK